MQNDLKWYLEQYQINIASGHDMIADNLMNELLHVKYEKRNKFLVPKFSHVDINKVFYRTYKGKHKGKYFEFDKLLDYNEFFSFFLSIIWRHIQKAKAFGFQNEQIKSWAVTRCRSELIEELKSKYDFNVTSENKNASDGTEYSLFDINEFREYQLLKNESAYLHFLNEKGGLRKILGSQDAEILELCFHKDYIGITQIQIGDMLKIDPKLVSKRFKKASKKLKIEFYTWKQINALKTSDTYETVANFLKYYDMVAENEGGNFDYYHFFITFLKDNYKKGDQQISIRDLHRNKKIVTHSIFDVLTDGLTDRKLWNVLYELLEYDESQLTPSQKNKAVIFSVRAFRDYIESSNRIIQKVSGEAVDWYDEEKKVKNEENLKKYHEFAKDGQVEIVKI